MLDEFIWGKVSRISPEAPVPIVNVTGESYYPGGAANVARNLKEFTGNVSLMGLAGEDPAGDRLLGLLEAAGIDTRCVQRDPALRYYREDADHRAQPAGGPRGPRAEARRDRWADRSRHRTIGRHDGRRGRRRSRGLRQGLRDPTIGRRSLPPRAGTWQDPDRGSASAHVARLERRDSGQAQSRWRRLSRPECLLPSR